MHKQLLKDLDSTHGLRLYYKKSRFDGRPMGVLAALETTRAEGDFRTLQELTTSTKM
jgi:hypothetical protein